MGKQDILMAVPPRFVAAHSACLLASLAALLTPSGAALAALTRGLGPASRVRARARPGPELAALAVLSHGDLADGDSIPASASSASLVNRLEASAPELAAPHANALTRRSRSSDQLGESYVRVNSTTAAEVASALASGNMVFSPFMVMQSDESQKVWLVAMTLNEWQLRLGAAVVCLLLCGASLRALEAGHRLPSGELAFEVTSPGSSRRPSRSVSREVDGIVGGRRSSTTVMPVANPFSNAAPWNRYEVAKAIIVGVTLFPLRLALLVVSASLLVLFSALASAGSPLQEDRGCLRHSAPWGWVRTALIWICALFNRLILLSLGFWHVPVRRRGGGAPSSKAKLVVVAPHQSIVDAFIATSAFPPALSIVSRSENLDIPGVHALGAASQCVFVNRQRPESRTACKDAIAVRAAPEWSGFPLMIFPEGTTTNGKVLVQFKPGPFIPGVPIQPVVLRYTWAHYDMSYVGHNSNIGICLLRAMLQFANYCEVCLLDVYEPSAEEQKDACLFASGVRSAMAQELGIATTEHTYEDVFLMGTVPWGSDFVAEEMRSRFDLEYEELEELIQVARRLDVTGSGGITREDLARGLAGLTPGTLGGAFGAADGKQQRLASRETSDRAVSNLFDFFDTDDDGIVSYRELVPCLALLSGRGSVTGQIQLAFLVLDVEACGHVRLQDLSINKSALPEGVGDALSFPALEALLQDQPPLLDAALEAARRRLGPGLALRRLGPREAMPEIAPAA